MRILLRSWNRNAGKVVRISERESARIAAKKPGPGLPLSTLPASVQRKLREGSPASLPDLMAELK